MRYRGYFAAVLACLAASLGGPAAQASSTKPSSLALIPTSTTIASLKDTRAPIGWAEFCARNARDCDVEPLAPRDVKMDAATWRLLNQVNDKVNGAIDPVTDQEHWGVVERWDYPSDGRGDCEDFVLEKRRRLIEAGAPRQSLLITVVRDKKGDGHAVLLVKTDKGDYVLDNQEAAIMPWSETGYGFVKRQSQEHPNKWVWLGEPRPSVVSVGNPK